MKNILVLLHDDRGQEARLQAALDVVRALDGHLSCLGVTLIFAGVGDYTGYSQVLLAEARTRESANRTACEARLGDEEAPYDWAEASGDFADSLARAARLADLIVVNRRLEGFDSLGMLGTAGELLVKTRRPVLAVPQDGRGFDAFGNALVAWDGSRGAAAALRAAMPLLAKARQVTLLELDDGSVREPATAAAAYCSRHGVRPVVVQRAATIGSPGEMLLQAVAEFDAAYAVFGGVTRRMLSESPVPVLLMHE